MTVDTTYTPATYTGDGSTVAFALNHLVYEASHVRVTLDGTVTVAYTITGINSPSGITVTFDTAPASGVAIVIQRVVPYTQETDLENFDGNPADVTEKQFDLLAMADQQIAEASNRSIFVPVGTSLTTNEISGTIDATSRLLTITSSGVSASLVSQFGNFDVTTSSEADGDLLVYNGTNWTNLKNNLTATSNPTVNDDNTAGYNKNSKWLNNTSGEFFSCVSATTGAADWQSTTLTIDELGGLALVNILDEDDFASNSATRPPSQQSTKAYVDAATAPSLGVAAAWGFFDGSSGSTSLTNGYNVSSVTRNSTGNYTITLSVTMTNTNYCYIAFGGGVNLGTTATAGVSPVKSTTQFSIQYFETAGGTDSAIDVNNGYFVVYGETI